MPGALDGYRTPAGIHRHAPALGEHTDEVLADLGFSAREIESAGDRRLAG